jgi:hypothetical protein
MPEMDVPLIVSLIRETYRIESKYQAGHPVTAVLLLDTIKGTYSIPVFLNLCETAVR